MEKEKFLKLKNNIQKKMEKTDDDYVVIICTADDVQGMNTFVTSFKEGNINQTRFKSIENGLLELYSRIFVKTNKENEGMYL
jgi:hypothetical protein